MGRLVVGALIGIVLLGAARFAFAPFQHHPHYHANFLVVVDGEPLDLSSSRYMEDASSCVGDEEVLPAQRVHMHDGVGDVVHVHHDGVTWGHFFSVLGFTLGDDHLILDDDRRFFDGEGGRLRFVVDGRALPTLHDQVVRPGDRVLVSWSEESMEDVLEEQFPLVPSDAPEYDERDDPAGCAGPTRTTPTERLRRAFWG